MITIDATKQRIGRVASQAAYYLLGKHQTGFDKSKISGEEVHITNASKTEIPSKKYDSKKYEKFSGYPSGLKFESLRKIESEKGIEEIYQKAVKRMLPDNKLRKETLKNLKVTK